MVCRRGFLTGTGVSTITVALAGCAGAPPPEIRKFYLSALGQAPVGLEAGDWTLRVDPPQAIPALNTTRIAQLIASNEFDYYADADWGDPAPLMFQSAVIRSFERTGAVSSVTNERGRTRPDFLLQLAISRFHGEGAVGTAAMAHVGVSADLTRYRGRELLGSASFEESVQAAAPGVDALVAAFNTASKSVLADLVAWTVSTGNRAGAGG